MARVPIFDQAGVPRYIGAHNSVEHPSERPPSRLERLFSSLGLTKRPPSQNELENVYCAPAAMLWTGVHPNEMLPPTAMDKSTVAELEAVRRRTPRYLYRVHSNGKGNETPSGGRVGLNTTEAITPFAFSQYGSGGHQSAYQMTRDEFTDMATRHLRGCSHMETEFSSWTASLSYALLGCPGIGSGNVPMNARDASELYISVIDVEIAVGDKFDLLHSIVGFPQPGEYGLYS